MDPLETIRTLVNERAAIYQHWNDPLWAIDGPRRLLEIDALLEAAWHERRRLCAQCRVGLTEAEAEALKASSDLDDRMDALALLEIVTGKTTRGDIAKAASHPTSSTVPTFSPQLLDRRAEFIQAWQTTRLSLLALAAQFGVGKRIVERAITALRAEGIDRPIELRYHDGTTRARGVRP